MPPTRVLLYQEADGGVPIKRWLEDRAIRRKKAFERAPEMHTYEEGYRGKNPQNS